MSATEFADRLLQITAVAGDKPRAALSQQLGDVLAAVEADPRRRAWLQDSAVASALAQAWRELGDYDKAVAASCRGTLQPYSMITLRDLQMLANTLSRLPAAGPPSEDSAASALLRQLWELEKAVLRVTPEDVKRACSAPALTPPVTAAGSERLCLQGSALLRQLDAAPTGDAKAALSLHRLGLLEAARCFVEGYLAKQALEEPADRRAYALSNAVLCAGLALLTVRRPATAARASTGTVKATGHPEQTVLSRVKGLLAPLEAGTDAVETLLAELRAQELAAHFWHYTAAFELRTAQVLLEIARSRLDRTAATPPPAARWCDELTIALRHLDVALVRWPSPSEKDSITTRLRLIQRLIAPALKAKTVGAEALRAHAEHALERLHAR